MKTQAAKSVEQIKLIVISGRICAVVMRRKWCQWVMQAPRIATAQEIEAAAVDAGHPATFFSSLHNVKYSASSERKRTSARISKDPNKPADAQRKSLERNERKQRTQSVLPNNQGVGCPPPIGTSSRGTQEGH